MKYPTLLALSALTCLGAAPALADIEVGVTISATGPAASLGIAEKNTIALLPTQVGVEKIHYTILDDASDTTQAVKNVRKLIAEDKVDVILGSTTTPNSLAMVDVAAGEQVAMIAFAILFFVYPMLIKSSASEMAYFIDWVNHLGICLGLAGFVGLVVWPFTSKVRS